MKHGSVHNDRSTITYPRVHLGYDAYDYYCILTTCGWDTNMNSKPGKPMYVIIHIKSLTLIAGYTNKAKALKVAEQNAQWFVKTIPTYRGGL